MDRDDPEVASLLNSIFEWLDAQAVQYGVMRNWAGLPSRLEGNDLDLLVRPEDCHWVVKGVTDVATSRGWHLLQRLSRPYIDALKLVHADDPDRLPLVLHIDFFREANWRAFSYLPASSCLDSRVKEDGGVWRFPPSTELFLTLSHHLLWSGALHKAKYTEQLRNADATTHQELLDRLQVSFGHRTARRILDWGLRGGPVNRKLQSRARAEVVFRAMTNPVRVVRTITATVLDELNARRHPRGLVYHQREEPGTSTDLTSLLDWLQTIWKYNHVLVGQAPGNPITGSRTDASAVERIAYRRRRTTGARRRRIGRLRARGWIIGLQSSLAEELSPGPPDLILPSKSSESVVQAAHDVVRSLVGGSSQRS